MRLQYVIDRLKAARLALDASADIRQGLYAAHLQLHTVLPEHLPDGELRASFTRIHDAFRHRRRSDLRETSVIEVIGHLDESSAAALAQDIRTLCEEVETLPPEIGRPRRPEAAASRAPRTSAPFKDKRVLIVYGSTEGHTRSVAEFAAAKLRAAGYEVALRTATEAERTSDLERSGNVIIAASLHWGLYQNSISKFVASHHAALNTAPSVFVSVSLAAAGVEQPGSPSLDECVDMFLGETSWNPDAVHHVGGGIRHSGYDYFKRLAVHLIRRQLDGVQTADGELDLADYGALEGFLLSFLSAPEQGTSEARAREDVSQARP